MFPYNILLKFKSRFLHRVHRPPSSTRVNDCREEKNCQLSWPFRLARENPQRNIFDCLHFFHYAEFKVTVVHVQGISRNAPSTFFLLWSRIKTGQAGLFNRVVHMTSFSVQNYFLEILWRELPDLFQINKNKILRRFRHTHPLLLMGEHIEFWLLSQNFVLFTQQ